MPQNNQCAIDAAGNLKDAEDILFYDSESDQVPLSCPSKNPQLGRGQRTKNNDRMLESIALDQQTGRLGNIVEKWQPRSSHSQTTTKPAVKRVKTNKHIALPQVSGEPDTDVDDGDFMLLDTAPSDLTSSESSDNDILPVSSNLLNAEIADILPAKTFPRGSKRKRSALTKHASGTCKKAATVEEIEDEDSPRKQSERSTHATCHIIEDRFELVQPRGKKPLKRNPIYHFYEEVARDAAGKLRESGDKHYKCYHGGRKVLTITSAMKSSLNGLIGNLKTCSPTMYRFYLVLKNRSPAEPTTEEEVQIASGKKVLEPGAASKFVQGLESKAENIRVAFNKQAEREAVGVDSSHCVITIDGDVTRVSGTRRSLKSY
ncbi:hypothetical protein BDZ94DRAFT_814316 [Collybia nuda]|uniref:Uncharacterized protein n=1 Tax=Collybia nuda TaxID=64659 RepID=A0A9P5XR11_9AGAR|nr:hypothetical protein BDZ94DRAFT_814316 [Collybia nuda]